MARAVPAVTAATSAVPQLLAAAAQARARPRRDTAKPEFLVSIKEYGEYYPVRFETEVGKLPACSVFKEPPVSRVAENWEVPWAQEGEAGGVGGPRGGHRDGGRAGGKLLKGSFHIRISHN